MAIDYGREIFLKQKEIEELKMDIAVLVALARSHLQAFREGKSLPLLPAMITIAMVQDIVDKWTFNGVSDGH